MTLPFDHAYTDPVTLPFDAVLDDERLPENFRIVRLPRMRERIGALRQRERERRSP
jgi:hypothetical protein